MEQQHEVEEEGKVGSRMGNKREGKKRVTNLAETVWRINFSEWNIIYS